MRFMPKSLTVMHSNIQQSPATLPAERIISIDILRGIAVLGILIVNIQSFSMIGAANINPTAWGDFTGINKWVWIISYVFASEKFMNIFSILFGAGIILLYTRKKRQGRHPGKVHYFRNFWLLVFGVVDAYFIWHGDFLVAYSLCGFFVYLFRKMKPEGLIILASFFFLVPVLTNLMSGFSIPYWPEESYFQAMNTWLPSTEFINKELSVMRGSFVEQMEYRIPMAVFMQPFLFFLNVFWRVVSMMLVGMALSKSGVILARKSHVYYVRMVAVGLSVGYLLSIVGVWQNYAHNWKMEYSMFFGVIPNYLGSIAVSLGYIGIVMLIAKSVKYIAFKRVLSAVGKMAFSSYIFMSVIAGLIFYGHGFSLFGKVERIFQFGIVLTIWVLILIISPQWLKHFNYGPLEWLWRVLTYRKKIPLKKRKK